MRELGTLDAAVTVASGSGIIARDASRVSAARDPGSLATYYARRHVFTLGGAATISISLSAANSSAVRPYVVLLSGRSRDGSGTVVAEGNTNLDSRGRPSTSASVRHLLLAAGTYTIEATTREAGATGEYSLWVQRWRADGCARELGALGAEMASASKSGIVAVDAGCVSAARNPGGTATYYARRHVFTLNEAATVSISVDDVSSRGRLRTYAVLLAGRSVDGSGSVVGRANSSDGFTSDGFRSASPARLDHFLLAAGTYTIEAATTNPGDTGHYRVNVNCAPADEPLGAALAGRSSVELVYDSALDESSVPPVDAIAVIVDGASRAITEVTVGGHVVTLTLASPVMAVPGHEFLLRSRLGLMQGDADVQTVPEES